MSSLVRFIDSMDLSFSGCKHCCRPLTREGAMSLVRVALDVQAPARNGHHGDGGGG